MSNSKELNKEELTEVNGGQTINGLGGAVFYTTPSEIMFKYPKGYHHEICDCVGIFHIFTHDAVITKRGYISYNDSISGIVYHPVYYFSGDSDVEGWYFESWIEDLSIYNYADNDRINPSRVTIVD